MRDLRFSVSAVKMQVHIQFPVARDPRERTRKDIVQVLWERASGLMAD